MVPEIISKYLKNLFDIISFLFDFFTMCSTTEIYDLLNNLVVNQIDSYIQTKNIQSECNVFPVKQV